MLIIGLTGSIAMGKSEVAKYLAGKAIPIFDADLEVHKLYDSQQGVDLLEHDVPSAIIGGKIDRLVLSKLVLADKILLEKIETIVHAEIAKRREAFNQQVKSQGHKIVVHDVPLLFEKGLDKNVDVTVVVSSTAAIQKKRALARVAMTPAKFEMIQERQMPDAEKRTKADYILENNGSLADLHARIDGLLVKVKTQHA